MSCSLTQAYLFSLTLTYYVDMTLQPCVNSGEKGCAVWIHADVVLNVLTNNVNHFSLLDDPNPSSP